MLIALLVVGVVWALAMLVLMGIASASARADRDLAESYDDDRYLEG